MASGSSVTTRFSRRDWWDACGWAVRLGLFLAVVYFVFGLLAMAIDRLPVEATDSVPCLTR